MYSNLITIEVNEINPTLSGSLKFRKPKASEMIIISEEQIKLQDENSERKNKGLQPKEVSAGLVNIIEGLVSKCFVSGANEGEEITKENFELNFLDLNSVLFIFTKISDMQGLGSEKQK
jgi:hypothetical protein